MNIFPDPIFLFYLAKHQVNICRPWQLTLKKIRKYQVKMLKKMIHYAIKTQLYQDKYKQSNVHLHDINEVDDIDKIPFLTKQDLRKYAIKDTLPHNFNIKKSFKVNTSGVTGKPITIYRDLEALAADLSMGSRMLKAYGLNVMKTRITNIGDFSLPNSYDEECTKKGIYKKLGFLASSRPTQLLFVGEDIKDTMKKLEIFKPDFIMAYPGTLIGLMGLRKEGFGDTINPQYIISSGGFLDSYIKNQIEDTFDTRIFDVYGATEGGMMAFECLNGNYHVQSDYVILGAMDKDGNKVPNGTHGHVVVTRLYGGGTPIIRYTGMDDFITLSDGECDCGMHTQLIKRIEGRSIDSIVLPDGRIFPPATFTLIPGEVTQEFGVDKIQQFQIIQHKKDLIEILLVINEEFRDIRPSVEELMSEIKNRYQQLVGKNVNIEIKEVKKVKNDKKSSLALPSIVISHVDHKDWI